MNNNTVLLWLQAKSRRSKHTGRSYREVIEQFVTFIQPADVLSASPADVEQYVNALVEFLAGATVNHHLAVLNSFYEFAQRTGAVVVNPAAGVAGQSVGARFGKSRPITATQCKQLLAVIDTNTPRGKRDYALIVFLLYTGRRVSEALGVRQVDVEACGDLIRYHWVGKGGTERWDDMPGPVYAAIWAYLAVSGDDHPSETTPIFHITPERVNQLVREYAQQARLPAWVHTHTLRHSAAQLRRAVGDDVFEISQQLAHASTKTTEIYLDDSGGYSDASWPSVARLLGDASCDSWLMRIKQVVENTGTHRDLVEIMSSVLEGTARVGKLLEPAQYCKAVGEETKVPK